MGCLPVVSSVRLQQWVFAYWSMRIKVMVLERKLKAIHKEHERVRIEGLVTELEEAEKRNDAAGQWRAARRVASATKGSKRALSHVPLANPTVADVHASLMRSAGEGGWNAACVDMGGLVAEHMQHSMNINYRTEQLRKRCAQSMHSL